MDVDRSGPGVEDAAVAVAALNQGPDGVLDSPRVLGWRWGVKEKDKTRDFSFSSHGTTEEDTEASLHHHVPMLYS